LYLYIKCVIVYTKKLDKKREKKDNDYFFDLYAVLNRMNTPKADVTNPRIVATSIKIGAYCAIMASPPNHVYPSIRSSN